MNTKPISKSHFTEKRFSAYLKANAYIKHLNRVYDSSQNPSIDSAYSFSKNFRSQTPSNLDFKVSLLPRSQISREIEEKTDLIHKYNKIEEIRPKRNKVTRISTPMQKKSNNHSDLREKQGLKILIHSILSERNNRCEDCKKFVCECIEKTKDNFLKKFINSKNYKEIKKNKDKKETNCFVTGSPNRNKESDFCIIRDQELGLSLFDDGSLTTINSYARGKRNVKNNRRVQLYDKDFDKYISISPISQSSRSKYLN